MPQTRQTSAYLEYNSVESKFQISCVSAPCSHSCTQARVGGLLSSLSSHVLAIYRVMGMGWWVENIKICGDFLPNTIGGDLLIKYADHI